jgi:hypothetical protein
VGHRAIAARADPADRQPTDETGIRRCRQSGSDKRLHADRCLARGRRSDRLVGPARCRTIRLHHSAIRRGERQKCNSE